MMLAEGMYDVPAGHVAAVVTYLEMTAPAMSLAKPLPSDCGIAKETMTPEAYRELFRGVGAPWLWTSRLVMADTELHAILTDPKTETWVLRQSGKPIALIELDFSTPDRCELAFFGMVKSATGQGLGGPMMAHVQNQAFRDGQALLTVHTCNLDDPRALDFYRKAGFTPVKRAVEVFPDPRLSGAHSRDTAPQIPCLI